MNVKLVLITLSALITLYFYNGQTIFKENIKILTLIHSDIISRFIEIKQVHHD